MEYTAPRKQTMQSLLIRFWLAMLAALIALPAVPIPASAYALHRRWIWVKQGSLTFVEGLETHVLGEGDCLELGPPQDCVFRNTGSEACIYAVILLRTG